MLPGSLQKISARVTIHLLSCQLGKPEYFPEALWEATWLERLEAAEVDFLNVTERIKAGFSEGVLGREEVPAQWGQSQSGRLQAPPQTQSRHRAEWHQEGRLRRWEASWFREL